MNEYLELFIRSIVTGMGSGFGTYLVLKIAIQRFEKKKEVEK